jgi:transposase
MRYVGADVHKNYTVFCVLVQDGEIEAEGRVENTPEAMSAFLDEVPRPAQLAVEASYHWQPFYELVEEMDLEVFLAHPYKVRLIAESRIKTDTIDARALAHLLRLDYLPTAYIPPRKVRDLREVLRHRAKLVRTRTQLKNRVHGILAKNGIRHPWTDLFGKGGRAFLEELELRAPYQLALRQDLAVVDTLNEQIRELDVIIEEKAERSPEAMLLTTMPGIGYYSALLILSEIGDITRFSTPQKLCSWAGLVPSTRSSGGRIYHGHLTKQGSRWLRWILTQAATPGIRGSPSFRAFRDRVARRAGGNAAKIALARKMLIIIHRMLWRGEPFQENYGSPAIPCRS